MNDGVFTQNLDNLTWFGFIDEIVVVASRTQLGAYLELASFLRFGNMLERTCDFYSDGGHCLSETVSVDVGNWPLADQCQTVSGTMGPLTEAEETQLDLEYQQHQHIVTGVSALGVALYDYRMK